MSHPQANRQPKTGLPPAAESVARDGVTDPTDTLELMTALRFVLMAALFAELDGPDMADYVYNTKEYGLARQLAYRRAPDVVDKLVNRHWRECEQRYKDRDQNWNVADALNIVKARLAHNEHLLDPRGRMVMWMAVAEAQRLGTTRPVLPEYRMAEITGIPHATVRRILKRLVAAGWLRIARPGKSGVSERARATIYLFGRELIEVKSAQPREAHSSTYSNPSTYASPSTTYASPPSEVEIVDGTTYASPKDGRGSAALPGDTTYASPLEEVPSGRMVSDLCSHGLPVGIDECWMDG